MRKLLQSDATIDQRCSLPISPFLRKVLLELLQSDVVTRNLGPVRELFVTETEHNGGEIARILFRFSQRGLIGLIGLIGLHIRLILRRGLVRTLQCFLFGNIEVSLLETATRHSVLFH